MVLIPLDFPILTLQPPNSPKAGAKLRMPSKPMRIKTEGSKSETVLIPKKAIKPISKPTTTLSQPQITRPQSLLRSPAWSGNKPFGDKVGFVLGIFQREILGVNEQFGIIGWIFVKGAILTLKQ